MNHKRSLPAWRIPRALRPFVLERGSLTAKLNAACTNGEIRVRVLREGWGWATAEEYRRLSLKSARMWIREVELYCDNQCWVYARSLIPPATYRRLRQRFNTLGNRPLGELLFKWRGQQRGAIDIRLNHGRIERSSCFTIFGYPLWVSETFAFTDSPGQNG